MRAPRPRPSPSGGAENTVAAGRARRRGIGCRWAQPMPLLTAGGSFAAADAGSAAPRAARALAAALGPRRRPGGRMASCCASRRERTPPIHEDGEGGPSGGHVPILADEASVLRRYGVALAATAAAYGASLLLWPLIDPNAFALFCAAVMVSAWYGGLGPGLLATGLATSSCAPLPASPVRSLPFGVNDAVRLGLFMWTAVLISALNAR